MALFSKYTKPAPEQISAQRTDYGMAILFELNRSGRHIYEGTVAPAVRAQRRAKNKAARRARAVHRRVARR